MAARTYVLATGKGKSQAVAASAVGTETLDATVSAGEIGIVIQGATTPNKNILRETIRRLADFVMETEKDN